jgi:vancomycin resistance protein VanJ
MFVLGHDEFEEARAARREHRAEPRNASASQKRAHSGSRLRLNWLTRTVRSVFVPPLCGLLREFFAVRTTTRYTARAMHAYVVGLLCTWLLLITTSEEWLPATALLYGPRAVVLLPLVVLLPASLVFARRTALLTLPALFIAVHSIMGYRFSLSIPARASGDAIRVVSFNVRGGGAVAMRVDDIRSLRADVIGIQECSAPLADSLRHQGAFVVHQSGAQCTASRWPIVFLDSMPRLAFQRIESLGYGGSGRVLRYRVQHPSQPFQVVNVHLETPRKGLRELTGPDGLIPDDGDFSRVLPSGAVTTAVDANAEIRLRESERASGWIASKLDEGPLVITGDFNQPVESTIFRQYWSAFTDAFEAKGRGFGYTKYEGTLLRARIDHVLLWPEAFSVQRAWVGPDLGSDHRPLRDRNFNRGGSTIRRV